MNGARRLLLRVLALAALSSCVSVLGLDEFRGAAQELCALLERCYGEDGLPGCNDHVGSGLADAKPAARLDWLTAFADRACLENCTSARGCLDIAPVCNPTGQRCDVREQCCGFSRGLASCDSARGACCVSRGVRCQGDDDCCDDVDRCEAVGGDETTKACGGVLCKLGGEDCASPGDCCSSVCEGGVCLDQACFPDGSFCVVDTDCCFSPCIDGSCGGITGCGGEGFPCFGPDECCPNLVCFKGALGPDSQGFCSAQQCVPDFEGCSDPIQCCSGFCNFASGACEPPFVCGDIGAPCELADECCSFVCGPGGCECAPDGFACIANEGCCSATCLAGVCQAAGCVKLGSACNAGDVCCNLDAVCNNGGCNLLCNPAPTCEHDVCTKGAALDPSLGCDGSGCVAKICNSDPFCCCTEWDQVCVDEVPQFCEQACANQ